MSCFRNASGQPLCNVVDHPDKPGESFCATCHKRFQDFRSNPPSDSQPIRHSRRELPSTIVDIITGVLALLLAAVINALVTAENTQPLLQSEEQPRTSIQEMPATGGTLDL